MNKAAKREYDLLTNSGDLLEMFPEFEGKWTKDRKKFIEYWESNQKTLMDLEVDFDEDELELY